MNYLQRFIEEVRVVLFITLLASNALLLGAWYLVNQWWNLSFVVFAGVMVAVAVVINFVLERLISAFIMQPIALLWRNILHISPFEHAGPGLPTKLTANLLGKDLVEALTNQIYQLVSVGTTIDQTGGRTAGGLHHNFIADSLPLPLVILDKDETIVFANKIALRYFESSEADLVGHDLKHRLMMTFPQNDQGFDAWLGAAKAAAATAYQTWDNVRLKGATDSDPLQFDLAVFYNQGNPDNCETLMVFFDHTEKYRQADQDVGFIALAVHELRTPITMLRGYIEALDEDLQGQLSGETEDFFNKLKVSSQQLTIFVNNILNVARIEGNQLAVKLHEEDWGDVLASAVDNLRLRASVHGIELVCDIADDLPTVAADRFSISEVITNLVDNAIKYSAGKGQKIVIGARLIDGGLIETTVKDTGVGIAESVVPTLFNKFQRNFHNKASIGGTGLGLYLSKVIVNLHGGNIWVSSKEGRGTVIGFTLRTYASLSEEQKTAVPSGIVHSSHGWIKNHSMSRR